MFLLQNLKMFSIKCWYFFLNQWKLHHNKGNHKTKHRKEKSKTAFKYLCHGESVSMVADSWGKWRFHRWPDKDSDSSIKLQQEDLPAQLQQAADRLQVAGIREMINLLLELLQLCSCTAPREEKTNVWMAVQIQVFLSYYITWSLVIPEMQRWLNEYESCMASSVWTDRKAKVTLSPLI